MATSSRPPPGPRFSQRAQPSRWTDRLVEAAPAILAGALVGGAILLLVWLWPGDESDPGSDASPPAWVQRHVKKVENPLLILPKPDVPATVPVRWRDLALGTRLEEIPESSWSRYEEEKPWGEIQYWPDPEDPTEFLGLSFYKGRLYRMVRHLTDASPIGGRKVLALSMRLYGTSEGYEYLTATHPHLVNVFETSTRVLKVDFIKTDEGIFVYQVELMDIEDATAREEERYRERSG